MTSRDFCYWLQGFFELNNSDLNKSIDSLSREQVQCVRNHLAMVFKHEIDPSYGGKKIQDELNKLHNGPERKDDVLMRC